MGLSRLENFLKSARGVIIYVDPNNLDSTDSIENRGNSLLRPFKSLQRALIESARFSYQRGLRNDRFNKTTIVLYPGDHLIDNRPGYIPTGPGTFSSRSGLTGLTDLTEWDLDTIFDVSSQDNQLYKLNSVYGGVIVPRGTSIVGMDLRKTKIRPLYVPDPINDNIERSCIFRTTGSCYFWQFTILDADPNGICYKNYLKDKFVPNFSHHKLTGFEYADGVNGIEIDDIFLSISDERTDLDMYYEKIARVYGESSFREIEPDYGEGTVDIQPVVDEYRIVGPQEKIIPISDIIAGNGTIATNVITVTLNESVNNLNVDTPIQISGVGASGYDGQHVVYTVINDTQITYRVQNPPTNANPSVSGATLSLVVDTVTSASPYIFNISLRSVYGMCGLFADGDKATGFKSMVVAQYTGIGLQKDDNAFVKYKYDSIDGKYLKSNTVPNLHSDPDSVFKPEYRNFHIKATNDAFLQLVSVFAIGYAEHFVTENGGDIALNNSNSNFGAKALVSSGFKRTAFPQDDCGYITHVIPPKEIDKLTLNIEFNSIDVGITTFKSVGAATTTHLYLYNETNEDVVPKFITDGYHIGAKENEQLTIQVFENDEIKKYSSKIVMQAGPYNSTEFSSEKVFTVGRSISGINSITSNTLNLTESHSFINGETIRIISDNGHLPDGLNANQIYYAITSGIGSNQIRIAQTLSGAIEATTGNEITLNNKGGNLIIVSRVSDKNAGDIGHPIQWNSNDKQWYITVSSSNNEIYDKINELGVSGLGEATSRTYVDRNPDFRNLTDTLYRVRYVIPKDSTKTARPPVDGYILQESNDVIGLGDSEISLLYGDTGLISSTALRNPKFIASASWNSNKVTIRTELPHNFEVGDQIEIANVSPNSYNGTYKITSIVSQKEFTYNLDFNPGAFNNNTSVRTASLPYVKRKRYNTTYQVYRTQEIKPFISGKQDGIYYLTLLSHSNKPSIDPFFDESFAQPVENLYPELNKDNVKSDVDSTKCHALSFPIGEVVVNNPQNSITKETLESFVTGIGITNITSLSGIAHTIYSKIDHGFSGITTVSIVSGGAAYGQASFGTLYNAKLVGFAGSVTGENATAKIVLGSGGSITGVKIIDGGSAYGIGNTLRVVGVATTSGFVEAVVRVESVVDNINDVIKIIGFDSKEFPHYNNLYRVTDVKIGNSKQFSVVSSETFSTFSTAGVSANVTDLTKFIISEKAISVSSFTYDSVTGLATVGFTTTHGFKVDNKIRISGANQSVFNGDFIVKKLVDNFSTIIIDVGVTTTSTSATGTIYAYKPVLTSYSGDLTKEYENISGRLNYQYAGITTKLNNTYLIDSTSDLNISNAVSSGLVRGDYILINDEIFRIISNVSSNLITVSRSLFGSPRQTHLVGSLIRKIKITPVELRRNSIIRASGHTFEYLGFGPGNYSTSLPERQTRYLNSNEKFLAQSTKYDGGIIVYTGMNSDGDFFAGNKKINSATGKEESFDTPIPSITGEKNLDPVVNITDTQKLFVSNILKVEGGRDKNASSEFDGPVIFNNKITSISEKGIEANSLLLHGDAEISRKITVGSTEPTTSGNYGDVILKANPKANESLGWVYTTDNQWSQWGLIRSQYDELYGVGISTHDGTVVFSSIVNFVGDGLKITNVHDVASGITTVNLTFADNINVSLYSHNSGIATHIKGGAASQILYQSAPNTTSFIPNGLSGQILESNGNSAPSWISQDQLSAGYATTAGISSVSISSGYATTAGLSTISLYSISSGISTNLKGGGVFQIPYQTSTDSTAFIPSGSNGMVLKFNGALIPPSWGFIDDLISNINLNSDTIKIHSVDGNSGDSTTYLNLVSNESIGFQNVFIDNDLKYNASTSTLESGTFYASSGNFIGNATSADQSYYSLLSGYASTSGFSTTSSSANYASISGVSTYSSVSGVSTYSSVSGVSTNIKGGTASQLVYQSNTDTTEFLPNGSQGQLLQSNGITAPSWSSDLNVGIITASIIQSGLFVGDGSGLIGLAGTGSGIILKYENDFIGVTTTLNFEGNVNITPISVGVCTVTIPNSVGIATTALNAEKVKISSIDGNSGNTTNYIALFPNNEVGFQTPYINSTLLYNAIENKVIASAFEGNLYGTATVATNVTLANDSNDAECFVAISTDATGNKQLKTNTNLKYNALTNVLTVGSLNGTASVASQLRTQSIAQNSNTYYLTFVDSNNTSVNPETFYTKSGLSITDTTSSQLTLSCSRINSNDVSGSLRRQNPRTLTGSSIEFPIARSVSTTNPSIAASGFSLDYQTINRITLSFRNITLSALDSILIQVKFGAGSFLTTGYVGRAQNFVASTNDISEQNFSNGFVLSHSISSNITGHATLTFLDNGVYVFSGSSMSTATGGFNIQTVGSISQAVTERISAIRIITNTATFTSGSMNIMIEG